MNAIRTKTFALAALCLGLAAAGSAHAGNCVGTTAACSLNTSAGSNDFSTATATYGKGPSASTSSTYTGSMGAWQVAQTSGTTSPFWVYCIDPLTSTTNPNSYTTTSLAQWMGVNLNTSGTATSVASATTASTYQNLFNGSNSSYKAANAGGYNAPSTGNSLLTTVYNELTTLYSYAYADSLTSNTKSAAFQFAIWEIEGSTTASNPNYVTGSGVAQLSGNSSVVSQANLYLAALNGGTSGTTNATWASLGLSAASYAYTVYQSSGSQTYLTVTKTSGGKTVPEPGSLALAFAAFGGIWVSRRKTGAQR